MTNDYAEQDARLADEQAAQQAEWDAMPTMTLTIETYTGGCDIIENKDITFIARELLDRVAVGWRSGTQPEWDMDELSVTFTIEGVDDDAAWERLVAAAMAEDREAVRRKEFWEADAIEQATPCPKWVCVVTHTFDEDPLEAVEDALRETRCSHMIDFIRSGEYELVCTSASPDLETRSWTWTPKSTLDEEAAQKEGA